MIPGSLLVLLVVILVIVSHMKDVQFENYQRREMDARRLYLTKMNSRALNSVAEETRKSKAKIAKIQSKIDACVSPEHQCQLFDEITKIQDEWNKKGFFWASDISFSRNHWDMIIEEADRRKRMNIFLE